MRPWLLSLDVTSVLVFVGMGRATHDSGTSFSGYLETAAPFLIALAAGWIATRAWRNPTGSSTAVGVAVTTGAIGMLLRRLVFGDGIAFSFIVVASGGLARLVTGWRLGARRWA